MVYCDYDLEMENGDGFWHPIGSNRFVFWDQIVGRVCQTLKPFIARY